MPKQSIRRTWLILIMLLVPQIALTEDCPATLNKCMAVVKDCGELNTAKNIELDLCYTGFKQMASKGAELNETVLKRDAQLNAWYRNPTIMFLLGVGAAGISYAIIRR